MRFKSLIIISLLSLAAVSFGAGNYTPGRLYIKIAPEKFEMSKKSDLTGITAVDKILREYHAVNKREAVKVRKKSDPSGLGRVIVIDVDANLDLEMVSKKIGSYEGIEYAEPNYYRHTDSGGDVNTKFGQRQTDEVPNDPFFSYQYYLNSIYAPAAWDMVRGDSSIAIAVVDVGVDWDHPDLVEKIWSNHGEIAGNGLDDDNNGYIDDIRGWDFNGNDNDPSVDGDPPGFYHGTHVAGIAAASVGNGIGIAGVAPECKIMAVKAGAGNTVGYSIQGITYAYENGARVINCSFGNTGGYSYLEEEAIINAIASGATVIAAAGNDGIYTLNYPSALNGVLSVTSIGADNVRSSFGNYHESVDVCAHGESIFSTVVSNLGIASYGYSDGTSMSTPIVAGIAGLLYSVHPEWNSTQVTVKIRNTCDDVYYANPGFTGYLGAGKVNAYRAAAEALPGLRYDFYTVSDTAEGDGDFIPESGDTLDLTVALANIFQDAIGVTAELSTTNGQVTVLEGYSDYGDIPAGSSMSNSDNPFKIALGVMQGGEVVTFNMFVETANDYTFSIDFTMIAEPPYANHDIGNVRTTVTNFGAIGYQNNPYMNGNYQVGFGFRYPADGGNSLYHGSIVLAYSSDAVCSSIQRETGGYQGFEWIAESPIIMQTPGSKADQQSTVYYRDHNVFNEFASTIRVEQNTYAWEDSPNDDFVILEFKFTNISDEDLLECYPAMFLDWDVGETFANSVGYRSDVGVGYMYSGNYNFYGMTPLTQSVYVHRAIDNNIWIYQNGLNDFNLYRFITGTLGNQAGTGSDFSHLISVGPLDIYSDSTATVAFAVAGGDNLQDLVNNCGNASFVYYSEISGTEVTLNDGIAFTTSELNPNPFNQNISFKLNMTDGIDVSVVVYDILGRKTAVIADGFIPAGETRIEWDSGKNASGLYFIRIEAGDDARVLKAVLMK